MLHFFTGMHGGYHTAGEAHVIAMAEHVVRASGDSSKRLTTANALAPE